jgi:hypothetical protein
MVKRAGQQLGEGQGHRRLACSRWTDKHEIARPGSGEQFRQDLLCLRQARGVFQALWAMLLRQRQREGNVMLARLAQIEDGLSIHNFRAFFHLFSFPVAAYCQKFFAATVPSI